MSVADAMLAEQVAQKDPVAEVRKFIYQNLELFPEGITQMSISTITACEKHPGQSASLTFTIHKSKEGKLVIFHNTLCHLCTREYAGN